MISMSLKEVAAAVGATCAVAHESVVVRRVSIDSREIECGDLFFAIRGPNNDAHEFVPDVGPKGAVAAVCDREGAAGLLHSPSPLPSPLKGEGNAGAGESAKIPLLVVDDTTVALGRLAAHYRRAVMPVGTVVIAVTGSNGKTTTKCMIDHVLSGSFKGRASPKNYNNHSGLPLTLLSAESDDQYLVAEIGTSAPGEIDTLTAIASPEVGVVTSIAEAHLEGLRDIHGVADEKSALLHHIRLGGLAVVNIDRPEIRPFLTRVQRARLVTIGVDPSARLPVADRRSTIRSSTFQLDGRFHVELPMPGAHHATNATAAFAVGRWFGLPCDEIIERLRTFVPPEGRTRVIESGGITIVDDAYNANPGSVRAAIEALLSAGAGRRVFVLGDMLELGVHTAGLHERIVAAAEKAGVDVLVGVGPAMTEAIARCASDCRRLEMLSCENADAACELVDSIIRPRDVVWIKGSRAVGLDRLVRHLESRWGPKAAVA
jgi:UDP-N-acetylmuramoyl-tripeptide--D-alanyl-D-alanine ligase